jgi:hypothetical protein
VRLLILDGQRAGGANPIYRGTYRRHPSYCDTAADDDEVNQLFFWFLESGGELGVVDDLRKALRYAALLNANAQRVGSVAGFEVVEVTEGYVGPDAGSDFFGFDLSSGYNNSLLWAGLKSYISEVADKTWAAIPRWAEFSRSYAPRLNQFGLFEIREDAASCLQQAMAIQNDFPSFFEGCDLNEFVVTGIHRLEFTEFGT